MTVDRPSSVRIVVASALLLGFVAAESGAQVTSDAARAGFGDFGSFYVATPAVATSNPALLAFRRGEQSLVVSVFNRALLGDAALGRLVRIGPDAVPVPPNDSTNGGGTGDGGGSTTTDAPPSASSTGPLRRRFASVDPGAQTIALAFRASGLAVTMSRSFGADVVWGDTTATAGHGSLISTEVGISGAVDIAKFLNLPDGSLLSIGGGAHMMSNELRSRVGNNDDPDRRLFSTMASLGAAYRYYGWRAGVGLRLPLAEEVRTPGAQPVTFVRSGDIATSEPQGEVPRCGGQAIAETGAGCLDSFARPTLLSASVGYRWTSALAAAFELTQPFGGDIITGGDLSTAMGMSAEWRPLEVIQTRIGGGRGMNGSLQAGFGAGLTIADRYQVDFSFLSADVAGRRSAIGLSFSTTL
jgi:hypothetical protein